MTTSVRLAIRRGAGPAAPAADRARLLAVAGGDRALVVELVGLYLQQVPTLTAQIESAAAGGDCDALRRAAHTLKGSLLTLAASEAAAAAHALELLGAAGGALPGADAAVASLARALARVDEALRVEALP